MTKGLRSISGILWPGLTAGALVGFMDGALTALGSPGAPTVWSYAHLLLWYAAAGGIGALGFSVLIRFTPGPGASIRPAAFLAVSAVAGSLLVANLAIDQPATHPLSLAADLLAVLLGVGVFLVLRRRGPSLERSRVFLAVPALLLAASILVGVVGTGPGDPPETVRDRNPSVLFLLVDTLRADHTSPYGYSRDTTPVLDRLSSEGLVFENAYAASSWTKPSVSTIATGLPPEVHGSILLPDKLPKAADTFPEAFRAAGYETALFSANLLVSREFGLDQGFDTVVDRYGTNRRERAGVLRGSMLERLLDRLSGERPGHRRLAPEFSAPDAGPDPLNAESLNAMFLDWLDGRSGKRWLAWIHYMDPHWPYLPPAPFDRLYLEEGRELTNLNDLEFGELPFSPGTEPARGQRQALIDAYDAAIAYWDHELGVLLAGLRERGVAEETLIVVLSDHGEGFYEHASWGHRNSLHQELVRVPLILKGPGLEPGRIPHSVGLESVAATVLDAAGYAPLPSPIRAGSLLSPLPTSDRTCRFHLRSYEGIEALGMIADRAKWIHSKLEGNARTQRFDLESDPREKVDLAGRDPELTGKVEADMVRRSARLSEMRIAGEGDGLSGGLEEALRGLGYLK